jgi:hypothetical protein
LLILEGRKPKDVRSSLKDCINYDDGLLRHRKVCSQTFPHIIKSYSVQQW